MTLLRRVLPTVLLHTIGARSNVCTLCTVQGLQHAPRFDAVPSLFGSHRRIYVRSCTHCECPSTYHGLVLYSTGLCHEQHVTRHNGERTSAAVSGELLGRLRARVDQQRGRSVGPQQHGRLGPVCALGSEFVHTTSAAVFFRCALRACSCLSAQSRVLGCTLCCQAGSELSAQAVTNSLSPVPTAH